MEKILESIEKYNIDIKVTDNINVDVVMCLLVLIALVFFIIFIVNMKKQKKVKAFTGKTTGTFESIEVYDSNANKRIKKALVRYTVNDKAIIKRMVVPKKQLADNTLNIVYNLNNPGEAILIGDNTYTKKAIMNIIISMIFMGLLIGYYIMFK